MIKPIKEIAIEDLNCMYCGYPIYKGESCFYDEHNDLITCSKTCHSKAVELDKCIQMDLIEAFES